MHFVERGSGEPLVLLHGNGEDGSYFEHQLDFFADSFHVVAPDTRGHGGTPRGTMPFTLRQFAIDLGDFLDGQQMEAANILGFSDGANVALMFGLEQPQRVRRLVLNGANLFPEGLCEQVRREIDEQYRSALASGDVRTVELMRLMTCEPHIDPAELSGLAVPTLVIAGTDDMIEERHTRLIAESIPGARLRFVEGSHFAAAENPQAFNREVAAFLQA